MIYFIQAIHFMMSLLLVLHSYSWKWKDQLHLSFKWRLSMTARASQFECSSPRLQLITMCCLVSCKDIVSIVHNTGESWTEPWIWTHVAVTHLPCRSQVSEDCWTLMYIVRSADIACRDWPLKRKLSTAQCVLCQVRCHCIFCGPCIRYSDIFCVPCIR